GQEVAATAECGTNPTRRPLGTLDENRANEPARVHYAVRRRSRVAVCGARGAPRAPRDRLPPKRGARFFCLLSGRAPPRTERDRLRRGAKPDDRIPLGRGQL